MHVPHILPIILSGGRGTRLWPMSRTATPKQLLCLTGENSLLQETALRVQGAPFLPPIVIAGDDHRFMVAEQLRGLGLDGGRIVLEPAGRDTAAAAVTAALLAGQRSPETLLLILPSDHAVGSTYAFRAAVQTAAPAAAAGRLVTFGVRPTHPETGYGYIRCGTPLRDTGNVFAVDQFVEKPCAALAESLVADGCLWNAGIFLVRADSLRTEIEAHAPSVLAAMTEAVAGARQDLDFLRLAPEAFRACPAISLDKAVMERTAKAAVLPVDMGWSDVGSWPALWDIGEKDGHGNHAEGDVLVADSRNCYLRSEAGLVAALGVDDLVVVNTDDAVLVARRDRTQEVGRLVADLEKHGRPEAKHHALVHRPWGTYKTLSAGARYRVKLITVEPGQRLSLQMHRHRAEHWVVVTGTARITNGTETFLLHENQSTYVPRGAVHRLENPGHQPLHLIEVQSGSSLDEDDIVRLADIYRREQA